MAVGRWPRQDFTANSQQPTANVVPNAKAAAAGTHDFFLSVGFGPLLQRSAEYVVDTKKSKGSGTVTVADHGAAAKVTFDARTADGVKLAGNIDCHSVMRGR